MDQLEVDQPEQAPDANQMTNPFINQVQEYFEQQQYLKRYYYSISLDQFNPRDLESSDHLDSPNASKDSNSEDRFSQPSKTSVVLPPAKVQFKLGLSNPPQMTVNTALLHRDLQGRTTKQLVIAPTGLLQEKKHHHSLTSKHPPAGKTPRTHPTPKTPTKVANRKAQIEAAQGLLQRTQTRLTTMQTHLADLPIPTTSAENRQAIQMNLMKMTRALTEAQMAAESIEKILDNA